MTEPFRYPNEFIDWVKGTYPEQFEFLIRGGAAADRQLSEIYTYWQEQRAKPSPAAPVKLGAPKDLNEYIDQLRAWLDVAQKTGRYDEETAERVEEQIASRVRAGEKFTGLPFYKEMAGGIDPATIFRPEMIPDPERVRKEREYAQYLKQREFGWKQPWKSWFEQRRPAGIGYQEELRKELEDFEGSKPEQRWFEQNYPSFVKKFELRHPELGKRWKPEKLEREQVKLEKSWAEELREFREERSFLSFYERGERPQYMAPRIRTVRR